jgi:hypothetical protein
MRMRPFHIAAGALSIAAIASTSMALATPSSSPPENIAFRVDASPFEPTPTATSVTGVAEATPTRAPSVQITEQEQAQTNALDAALDASDPLVSTPAPTSTPPPAATSTTAPTATTVAPAPTTRPAAPTNPGRGVVWASAFAQHATTYNTYGTITGTNDVETLLDVADNGIWYAGSPSEMMITPDGNLRVRYIPRTTGNSQGSARVQWTLKLPPANDLWLRYRFRTSPNWVAVRGGKLPGLASGPDNTNWSLRLMWRPKTTDPGDTGRLVVYPARGTDRVGDINLTGDRENATFVIIPGQWHEVVQHVTVNPGHLDMWLDGTNVLSQDRTISNNPTQEPVDCLFFSTFYGGNDASWAPPTTTEIDFADFVVSTTPL